MARRYDLLDILKNLYSEILIPDAVYGETVLIGLKKGFKDAQIISTAIQDGWIKVYKPPTKCVETVTDVEARLSIDLSEGERQAIALALEKNILTILTNDEDACEVSKILNLTPKGILYILLKSVKEKFINKDQVKKLLKQMLEDGFWLSPNLVHNFHEALSNI